VLIDHQLAITMIAPSLRPEVLVNNVAGLAAAAKALRVPTILTTVGAKGSLLVDPIFKELSEIFSDTVPIDRTSTHAWSHPDVRAAIEATGRKKLIMAGVATEVCLAQSVLSALKEGFEVYFVSDCSAGVTQEAHDDAKLRMTMAGETYQLASGHQRVDAGSRITGACRNCGSPYEARRDLLTLDRLRICTGQSRQRRDAG